MHISERGYLDDVRRCNLALRLIAFEARTHTIRRMTGLTDHRIRAVGRRAENGQNGYTAIRHRGKSPHCVDVFFASPQIRTEAAAILSLCRLMQVSPARTGNGASRPQPDLSYGERLCDAYERFRQLCPETRITLEHLILLLWAVGRKEHIATSQCLECRALIVVDPLGLVRHLCEPCRGADWKSVSASPPVAYLKVAEESPEHSPTGL